MSLDLVLDAAEAGPGDAEEEAGRPVDFHRLALIRALLRHFDPERALYEAKAWEQWVHHAATEAAAFVRWELAQDACEAGVCHSPFLGNDLAVLVGWVVEPWNVGP